MKDFIVVARAKHGWIGFRSVTFCVTTNSEENALVVVKRWHNGLAVEANWTLSVQLASEFISWRRECKITNPLRDEVQIMTNATICRHHADEAICVVEECRAKGLVEIIRDLVEVGGPHEDVTCPEDDTCACKLAARVNAVLGQDAARKAYRESQERKDA